QSGAREGSLLAAIDRTVTAAGARRLAERLSRPLRQPAAIEARLQAVEWFVERRPLRRDLRSLLKGGPDLARALSRLDLGRGGPRDLAALRDALACAGEAAALFAGAPDPLAGPPPELAQALAALNPPAEVAGLQADLARGLAPEP